MPRIYQTYAKRKNLLSDMIEITEKEFEDRKDFYCDKAETGTVVLVEKPDGAKILVVPQNPNNLNYDYLRDHDDGC
jgi:hypothetical protein